MTDLQDLPFFEDPSMNNPSKTPGLSYRDAGVDIDAGDALVDRIKPLAKKTMREGVLAGIGGFGALFEVPKRYKEPILVSGTDGVGTKIKLAFEWNAHETIGQDLVAMSVNDILVQGAESLFFLDYFACGKLSVDTATTVIAGIAKGCELAGCALIGGETAEMPGMYGAGDYDLAGFSVGAVDRDKVLPRMGDQSAGDLLIGLGSSGPHSNGYSLIRKIVEVSGLAWGAPCPFAPGVTLAEALMAPTRIYVRSLVPLIKAGHLKGLAHITGGGLIENPPRCIAEGLQAKFDWNAWTLPPVFQWLQEVGGVAEHEMRRTFNCGVGMLLIVAPEHLPEMLEGLLAAGEDAFVCGELAGA